MALAYAIRQLIADGLRKKAESWEIATPKIYEDEDVGDWK
jgi:hypothetical protein